MTTAAALIFTGVDGVVEGQVIQEEVEDFTMRVVPAARFGAQQEDQLKHELRKRIGDV